MGMHQNHPPNHWEYGQIEDEDSNVSHWILQYTRGGTLFRVQAHEYALPRLEAVVTLVVRPPALSYAASLPLAIFRPLFGTTPSNTQCTLQKILNCVTEHRS